MNTMKYRALSIIIAIAAAIPAMALNEKFFHKADEKVWTMEIPEFNPRAEIPDSVADGASAVIIADYLDIKVDREIQQSALKATGMTNRMTRDKIRRVMVKMLDQSAVERFTDFEFGDRESFHLKGMLPMLGIEKAWGARVHKPDGTLSNVDIKDAFTIGDGKKGDDNRKFKIAVPGLSVGDVLEYYYYTEEWLEEFNLPSVDIDVVGSYPVLNLMVKGEFNPDLTIEYRSYNGAPLLYREVNERGYNAFNLHVINIPAVNIGVFTSSKRQVPFIRMNFLNNTSMIFRPRSARAGGFYGNLPAGTYYTDVANMLKATKYDNSIPGRTVKLVKDYQKNHPDLTDDELAEVAWVAFNYVIINDDRHQIGDRLGAVMFCDILRKLKIESPDALGIGILNSRSDVPVNEIISWNDPDYVAVYGETIFSPPFILNHQPGEPAGIYQGEMIVAFHALGDKIDPTKQPVVFNVKSLKHTGNATVLTTDVTIDDDRLRLSHNMKLTGAQKDNVAGITTPDEWIMHAEEFLGIPDGKRVKSTHRDTEGRQKEIREAMFDWIENSMGTRPESIDNAEILSRGNMPGEESIEYNVDCVMDGLVSRTGNDYNVNIGRIFGRNPRLEGKDRERSFDAMLTVPIQDSYIVTLHIPEGYSVSTESLAALNTKVINLAGMFYSDAHLNEAGDLVIQSRVQLKSNVIPLSHWPELLAVLDAAALFNDSSVILTKK